MTADSSHTPSLVGFCLRRAAVGAHTYIAPCCVQSTQFAHMLVSSTRRADQTGQLLGNGSSHHTNGFHCTAVGEGVLARPGAGCVDCSGVHLLQVTVAPSHTRLGLVNVTTIRTRNISTCKTSPTLTSLSSIDRKHSCHPAMSAMETEIPLQTAGSCRAQQRWLMLPE